MTETLNDLSRSLLAIAPEKSILDDLNITDINDNHDKYVAEFDMAVELLRRTVDKKDKVAIQCALTRVRITSLNLSNIYQDIIDDVMLINGHESWPSIPEGYKIPEEYNEPQK
ncbi:hypothetical protein D3C80_948870 [compost metagenome]